LVAHTALHPKATATTPAPSAETLIFQKGGSSITDNRKPLYLSPAYGAGNFVAHKDVTQIQSKKGEITMFHEITIIGHLGSEPEMRYTPSGQAVTNFSLAANRRYTNNNGEQVEETTWFRVAAWGRLAETCNQYLGKGRLVFVKGRLNADPATGAPRIWTRQDDSPGASFEVTASTVRFLSTKADDVTGPTESTAKDDIPF
jgi:single-strand DNA-binding protein